MMQDLDRQQIEEYERENRVQADHSRRRSRKRKKKKHGMMRMLILAFCAMLWGILMAFRDCPSASENNQEIVMESSRPVVPQTIPESGVRPLAVRFPAWTPACSIIQRLFKECSGQII